MSVVPPVGRQAPKPSPEIPASPNTQEESWLPDFRKINPSLPASRWAKLQLGGKHKGWECTEAQKGHRGEGAEIKRRVPSWQSTRLFPITPPGRGDGGMASRPEPEGLGPQRSLWDGAPATKAGRGWELGSGGGGQGQGSESRGRSGAGGRIEWQGRGGRIGGQGAGAGAGIGGQGVGAGGKVTWMLSHWPPSGQAGPALPHSGASLPHCGIGPLLST